MTMTYHEMIDRVHREVSERWNDDDDNLEKMENNESAQT